MQENLMLYWKKLATEFEFNKDGQAIKVNGHEFKKDERSKEKEMREAEEAKQNKEIREVALKYFTIAMKWIEYFKKIGQPDKAKILEMRLRKSLNMDY